MVTNSRDLSCSRCGRTFAQQPRCRVCSAADNGGTYCHLCGTAYKRPRFCSYCGASIPTSQLSDSLANPDLPPGVFAPVRPRKRFPARRIAVGCGCLPLTLLLVLVIVIASDGDLGGMVLTVGAAVVPAIVYSWIILSLDKYEKEPLSVVLFAFGWGAVAAIFFSLIAELVFSGSVLLAADEDTASIANLVIGAPVLEETFKGTALLLLLWFHREEFDNMLDGLIYGALIGLGFAMTENIFYFITAYQDEGTSGLGELFVLRAVINGFGHAIYTGVIGAAVGWSRSRYSKGSARIIVPFLGFCAGVFIHMCWNGGIVAFAHILGDDTSIWLIVAIETALFIIPPLLIGRWMVRRASKNEQVMMERYLQGEVDIGVLTKGEFETLTNSSDLSSWSRTSRKQNGIKGWWRHRQFAVAAADIAFRKYHVAQGQTANIADWHAIQQDRYAIAQLRPLIPTPSKTQPTS